MNAWVRPTPADRSRQCTHLPQPLSCSNAAGEGSALSKFADSEPANTRQNLEGCPSAPPQNGLGNPCDFTLFTAFSQAICEFMNALRELTQHINCITTF
jgi:hypothetical protein